MADSESKLWTFFKGVGGIISGVLVSVLAALLIYHFTQPKPTPPPPPPLPQLGLNGFVRNSATQAIVQNALVQVGLGTAVAQQHTDGSGQYAFILTGTGASGNDVHTTVSANGYQNWSGDLTVPAGPQIADLSINPMTGIAATPTDPTPTNPTPTNPTATPGPVGPVSPAIRAGVTFRPVPQDFRMRAATLLVRH